MARLPTSSNAGSYPDRVAKCLELERASVGHVIDQLERAHVERRAVEGESPGKRWLYPVSAWRQ